MLSRARRSAAIANEEASTLPVRPMLVLVALGMVLGTACLGCDRGQEGDAGPAPAALDGDPAAVDVERIDAPLGPEDALASPAFATPIRLAPDARAQVRTRPAAIAELGLVDVLHGAVALELRLLTSGLLDAWRAFDDVGHLTCVELTDRSGADVGCVAIAGEARPWGRWWDTVTLTVPVAAAELDLALWIAAAEPDADAIWEALEPTLDGGELAPLADGHLGVGRRGKAVCAVWIGSTGVLLTRVAGEADAAPLNVVSPVVRHTAAWLGSAAAQAVPLRDDPQEVVTAFDGRGSSMRLRAKGTSLASALRLTTARHGASQTQLAAAQQGFGLLDEGERRRLARRQGVPDELMDAALLLMRGTSVAAVGTDALIMTSVDLDDLRAALSQAK